MKLQVTTDRSSLATARATAQAAERAMIEDVFQQLETQGNPKAADREARWSRVYLSGAERGVLGRNRAEVIPRLLAIVTGQKGEAEPVRLMAAVLLGEVDRALGIQAILPLLNNNDAQVLADALHELRWIVLDDEPTTLDLSGHALAQDDVDRLSGLLDYPDDRVATHAAQTIGLLKPAGMIACLLPRADDPILGAAVRRALAEDGRCLEILDRALPDLTTPGEETAAENGDGLGRHNLDIVERFARESPDTAAAARARKMLTSLKDSPRATAEDRTRIENCLRELDQRDASEASRPADLECASARVDRLVAAGIIDRQEGDAAIICLRRAEDESVSRGAAWGVSAAFEAARIRLEFHQEGSDYPPPHDELIHKLAAASRGAFVPEAVYQLRPSGEDDYPVQFVHRDRLYRVMVEYRCDWYDAGVIVASANAALKDAGDVRRFVRVGPEDPSVELVFTEPDRLRTIAPEIGLELGPHADPALPRLMPWAIRRASASGPRSATCCRKPTPI
jgi:hypothetical protein